MWENYNNYNLYRKYNCDETFEYLRLYKEDTGIDAEILIDSAHSYARHNHPLWLYFRNGYGLYKNDEQLIPISVCRNPKIMVSEFKQQVTDITIAKIEAFICRNCNILEKYANEQIGISTLYQYFKIQKLITEGLIVEMPVIDVQETGLPMNIWIDSGRTLQHAPRLKFQPSNDNKISKTWPSMIISKNKPEVINDKKTPIKYSSYDIDLLKEFVKANYGLLMRCFSADKFQVKTDFIPYVRKIDKYGNITYSQADKSEPIIYNDNNLIRVACDFYNGDLIFVVYENIDLGLKLNDIIVKDDSFKKGERYYVVSTEYPHKITDVNKIIEEYEKIAKANGFEVEVMNNLAIR